jgi:hypothetical protein
MSRHIPVAGFDQPVVSESEPWYAGIASSIGNSIVDAGRNLLGTVVNGINTIMPSALPTATAALAQLSYRGTTGNFQSAMEPIVLSAKFQKISPMNPETQGSPCYLRDRISTFSGFVMCDNPVFQSSIATSVEESAVEAMMAKGFFYE